VRLYRRYEREIVNAHDFCPWAVSARREGRIAERVLLERGDQDLAPSLAVLDALGPETDLALLLYPRFRGARDLFERFAGGVRDASSADRTPGKTSFVFVAFHPVAQAQLGDPERLIPFLRRTPDPTIQVVRSTVLDKVRAAVIEGTQFVDPQSLDSWQPQPQTQTIRERIAHANLATTLRIGLDALTGQIEDIIRDREETYRRLEGESE